MNKYQHAKMLMNFMPLQLVYLCGNQNAMWAVGRHIQIHKTQENYLIPFSLLVPLQNCMKTYTCFSPFVFYAEWGSERVNFCPDSLPFPLFCFEMFGNWVLYYNNCVIFFFFYCLGFENKSSIFLGQQNLLWRH